MTVDNVIYLIIGIAIGFSIAIGMLYAMRHIDE